MSAIVHADFVKRFPSGAQVEARLSGRDERDVTAILGPSGSGKTTILRCLAGLERPDRGTIEFGGEVWFDFARGIHLAPERRGIGFLFHDYALFPHMTVEGNIAFALPRLSADARRDAIADALSRFQLTGLERRYPSTLSAGQQQRVALARSVVRRPRLLLLDEPLAALDAPTRDDIRPTLKRYLDALDIPVYLVTHDRLDALTLAARIVVVDEGRIVQEGSIGEVFSSPATARVAKLVGVESVTPGRVLSAEGGIVTVAVGRTLVRVAAAPALTGDVEVCIRAEDVTLLAGEAPGMSALNQWEAEVVRIVADAGIWRVTLDCGFPLTAVVTAAAGQQLGLHAGARIRAIVKATAALLVPASARSRG